MSKGIYKISNPNGEIYIGKSMNIEKRWQSYKGLCCKKQPLIYDSLLRYGVDKHIFEIVEECPSYSEKDLSEQELKWYLNLMPELNVMKPGIFKDFDSKIITEMLKILEWKIMIRKMMYNLSQSNIKEFTRRLILLRDNKILSFTLSNTGVEIIYNN